MKAADGTKIAERWAPMYKNAMAISEERPQRTSSALAGVVTETIEELSAAEERERVLRDALEQVWKYAAHGTATKQKDARGRQFAAIHDLAITALATPTPEQPAQPSAEKAGSE